MPATTLPNQENPNPDPATLKKEKKERKAKKSAMVFLNELKARLDCYFRIVVRNIRDTVPRLIGHFLVRVVQNKMQIELFKRLNQMFEAVDRSMGEPIGIIQERKALTAQVETLRKADRVLTRDPEITTMISTSDDELLFELRQEKAEEASGKKVDQKEVIEKCMQSVLPELRQTNKSKPAPAPAPAPEPAPTTSPPKSGPTMPVNPPKAPGPTPPAAAGVKPKSNPFGVQPPAKTTNLFPEKPK